MKIFRDTASKLEQARQDAAACDAAILSAQQERLSKLADAEPDELIRLDRSIEDRHRQRQIFIDRVTALESKLADERDEQRKQAYREHVLKLEKALSERYLAAAEVEAAIRAFVAASTKLRDVSARLSEWPNSVERPPWHSGFRATNTLGELIRDCFVPWVRPGVPAPTSAVYVERLFSASERCAGFAAALKESDAQIIADLKDPSPKSDEEAAA